MDTKMTAGEIITPDAGEGRNHGYDRDSYDQEISQGTEDPSIPKKSFDELIEGEYRHEYGEKVKAVVKSRLKDYAETRQRLSDITDMITELGSRLGVEGDDPRQIIDAIAREKNDTDSEAQGLLPEDNEEGDHVSEYDPVTVERVKELAERVKQAKEYYPELDIATELADPSFAMLLRICQNDPKRAYEMKYHDRIVTNAMHYAVRCAEQRLAENIMKRSFRPSEGAAVPASAVMIASDPKSLTKQQRSDIKKRVRRGEKIFWN